MIVRDPGSFRDPSGGVFHEEGKVRRWVGPKEREFFRNLVEGKFFEDLVSSGRIVATRTLSPAPDSEAVQTFGADAGFFEHETLVHLTFPYEWPASMVKKAGEHTLLLQQSLLGQGLSLKDATPYNIQFIGTRPIFLDLTSIEPASQNGVWSAYNQFCRLVLYPLLLNAVGSMSFLSTYLSHLDGVTLEETVKALGLAPFRRYGTIFDYLIPALAVKLSRFSSVNLEKRTVSLDRVLKNSTAIQALTAKRLIKAVKKIKTPRSSNWSTYEDTCSYTDEETSAKEDFIKRVLETGKVKTVFDIGANTGRYSRLAAQYARVLACDLDHDCVETIYKDALEKDLSIAPIVMDIAKPSPGLGWFNQERPSFPNRFKERFDLVLALALVHHLIVTARVPLTDLARLFSFYSRKYLVIEYVDQKDSMFQRLLRYRKESYDFWTRENFEKAMAGHFKVLSTLAVDNPDRAMHRILYVMEKVS